MYIIFSLETAHDMCSIFRLHTFSSFATLFQLNAIRPVEVQAEVNFPLHSAGCCEAKLSSSVKDSNVMQFTEIL